MKRVTVHADTIEMLNSIWCTHDGISREQFETAIREMVERRGDNPESITYKYGLSVTDINGVQHDAAVNVLWRSM